MEISDRTLQSWDIVDIVDCLPCCMVGIESLDVIEYQCGRRGGVQVYYGFASCGSIEEEGVHVEFCDLGSEGYPP